MYISHRPTPRSDGRARRQLEQPPERPLLSLHVYVYIYISIYLSLYIYIYIYRERDMYTHVCMYVYICIYTYICIVVYIISCYSHCVMSVTAVFCRMLRGCMFQRINRAPASGEAAREAVIKVRAHIQFGRCVSLYILIFKASSVLEVYLALVTESVTLVSLPLLEDEQVAQFV